jgi:4-amino-4-deoxy-L-arabinose transferase-like glycosyltransferase
MRLAGRRASLWAEAFAAANFSFAYYGRATNLDGPALMWTALSVERLLRAGEAGDQRDLTAGAVFAALAVATKDQSYATFVLVLPLVAIAFARARQARGGAWLVALVRSGGIAALVYGAASGALLNPTGFVTRLRTLGGPASGDYRAYTRDVAGVMANLHDLATQPQRLWWPWPVVALAWMGVALAIARAVVGRAGHERRRDQIWLLGPLAAGVGCLVAFTLMVGRTEHRFVLPLGFWLSFYVGLAIEAACAQVTSRLAAFRTAGAAPGGTAGTAVTAAGALLLALSAVAPVELCATQWADGRRAVERWLAARAPGTTVETYGPLVYQPRFAAAAQHGVRVTRVGPEPVTLLGRNPQAGMEERQGRVADVVSRSPDIVVLTEGFAGAYLDEPPGGGGHVVPEVARRERADAATTMVVRTAVAGALPGYRLCFVAAPHLPFPLVARQVHLSAGERTWVLARDDVSCETN